MLRTFFSQNTKKSIPVKAWDKYDRQKERLRELQAKTSQTRSEYFNSHRNTSDEDFTSFYHISEDFDNYDFEDKINMKRSDSVDEDLELLGELDAYFTSLSVHPTPSTYTESAPTTPYTPELGQSGSSLLFEPKKAASDEIVDFQTEASFPSNTRRASTNPDNFFRSQGEKLSSTKRGSCSPIKR